MRTIAHISDLHFGRVDAFIPPVLHQTLLGANPDIVVVSGDLTQRARRAEFAAGRAFLDSLPFPQIVVPGNHDVPLHNVMRRWLAPLNKYRQLINTDVEPFYSDSEVAIQGLNSARSLTWKNGRLNQIQVQRACTRLSAFGPGVIRIVVTHHPFDLPDRKFGAVVGRAAMAMAAFARCGVDLVLSGHLHSGHAAIPSRYGKLGHTAILVQAGTASSSRRRSESNSWNLIRIDPPDVTIERQQWEPSEQRFVASLSQTFRCGHGGWTAVSEVTGL